MRRQMWREKAAAASQAALNTAAAEGAETQCTSKQSQEPFLDSSSQDFSGTSTTATLESELALHEPPTGQDASADSSAADAQQSPDAAPAKAASGSDVFQSEQ